MILADYLVAIDYNASLKRIIVFQKKTISLI